MAKQITYRVNDGQQIPHFDGKTHRTLKGGDTIEGPAEWKREFAGRMTAVSGDTEPTADPRLETAEPHEAVTYLSESREKLAAQLADLDQQIASNREESERRAAEKATTDAAERAAAASQGHPTSGQDPTVKVRNVAPDAAKAAPTSAAVEDVQRG